MEAFEQGLKVQKDCFLLSLAKGTSRACSWNLQCCRFLWKKGFDSQKVSGKHDISTEASLLTVFQSVRGTK